MRYLSLSVLVLALVLAACQPRSDVPALPAAAPTSVSVAITAMTDHSLESASIEMASARNVGDAELVVDTAAFGRPVLKLSAIVGARDSLDSNLTWMINVTLRGLVPDSALSFSDHTIAPGTYPLGTDPETPAPRVEVEWNRSTGAASRRQSLYLPDDVDLTGTLVVESVRAGIAYGRFEVEAELPEAGATRLVGASGQFRARVRWPGVLPDATDEAPGRRP